MVPNIVPPTGIHSSTPTKRNPNLLKQARTAFSSCRRYSFPGFLLTMRLQIMTQNMKKEFQRPFCCIRVGPGTAISGAGSGKWQAVWEFLRCFYNASYTDPPYHNHYHLPYSIIVSQGLHVVLWYKRLPYHYFGVYVLPYEYMEPYGLRASG